jgi:hypothetical protein
MDRSTENVKMKFSAKSIIQDVAERRLQVACVNSGTRPGGRALSRTRLVREGLCQARGVQVIIATDGGNLQVPGRSMRGAAEPVTMAERTDHVRQ